MCSIKKRCAAVLLVCLIVVLHVMPVMAADLSGDVSNGLVTGGSYKELFSVTWEKFSEKQFRYAKNCPLYYAQTIQAHEKFLKVKGYDYTLGTMTWNGSNVVMHYTGIKPSDPSDHSYELIGFDTSGNSYFLEEATGSIIAGNKGGANTYRSRMSYISIRIEIDPNGNIVDSSCSESFWSSSSENANAYLFGQYSTALVFDSVDSMQAYVETGDESGIINVQSQLPITWPAPTTTNVGDACMAPMFNSDNLLNGWKIYFSNYLGHNKASRLSGTAEITFIDSSGQRYVINSQIKLSADSKPLLYTSQVHDTSTPYTLTINYDYILGAAYSNYDLTRITIQKIVLDVYYSNVTAASEFLNSDTHLHETFTYNAVSGILADSAANVLCDTSSMAANRELSFDIKGPETSIGIFDTAFGVADFITSGFGLFGSSGLFGLLGSAFTFIPSPIISVLEMGVGLVMVVIGYKLFRG